MSGRRGIKVNVFVTDAAWEGLKQMAYERHYVRLSGHDARPYGLSAFITMLSWQTFRDTRPEYMLGTGQWITGMEHAKLRCVSLSPDAQADLGQLAIEHGIYPYRCQMPVANGFRRQARVPILYAPGSTPNGASSTTSLIGPVLDAIGNKHLTALRRLPDAPPNLYQGPSLREVRLKRRIRDQRTSM